jgi:hypothetical protein
LAFTLAFGAGLAAGFRAVFLDTALGAGLLTRAFAAALDAGRDAFAAGLPAGLAFVLADFDRAGLESRREEEDREEVIVLDSAGWKEGVATQTTGIWDDGCGWLERRSCLPESPSVD